MAWYAGAGAAVAPAVPSSLFEAPVPSRGLFQEGAEHQVVGFVSHVDSWLEVGAARWGGGAVDLLGVVRERLCGQLPDAGAGVGGHGGDQLVDALRVALIHQQADREGGL